MEKRLDPVELDEVLKVLREHGVVRAKVGGLEVEFQPSVPDIDTPTFDEQFERDQEVARRIAALKTHKDIKFPGS